MTITEAARPSSDERVEPRDAASLPGRHEDPPLPSDEVYQHLVDALRQRDRRIEHLETALRSNRTIGIAVGILMATLKCPRDEAFAALAGCSNTMNRKVAAIADYLEQTGTLPGSPADVDARSTRGT